MIIEEVNEIDPKVLKELVDDWTNRNTITGQVIFTAGRTRKGTYRDKEHDFDEHIYNNIKDIEIEL